MMGVHSGINTWLKDLCQEVNSGDSILITWCLLHQLNLKVDYYLTKLKTGIYFRPALNRLIGYLQSAKSFTLSMERQNDTPLLNGSLFRIHWNTCHSNKMQSMNSMSRSKRQSQGTHGGLFCWAYFLLQKNRQSAPR